MMERERTDEAPLRPWRCEGCGLRVFSPAKPTSRTWADGHTCRFVPVLPSPSIGAPALGAPMGGRA